MKKHLIFKQLFDYETNTFTYLLADKITKEAFIIDPVIEQSKRDIKLIKELWLKLKYIIDTHIHADHITWSNLLREEFNEAKVIISIKNNLKCADIHIKDWEIINLWKIHIKFIETPWHTNWCISILIENMVFTWDLLLIRKTWRTDFQSWSSEDMYNNIKEKIYTLDDDFIVFPAHDYMWFNSSTIWEEKIYNTRINDNTKIKDFKEIMDNLKLPYPKKIDISLPKNINCGK